VFVVLVLLMPWQSAVKCSVCLDVTRATEISMFLVAIFTAGLIACTIVSDAHVVASHVVRAICKTCEYP
jgi:hypothetical protein